MTLNRLEVFITVAQTLNFSQAAKQHFVSQTAVSQHIRALEEELGIQLLERTRHSVRLTAAGRVYYEHVVQVLSLLKTAEEKARLTMASEVLTLNIDIMPGLENFFFIDVLRDYKNQEPVISYQFHRSNQDTIRQRLLEDKTDMALLLEIYPFASDNLRNAEIARVQNYVVTNQASPLAHFPSVTVRQLETEQLYMISHSQSSWSHLSHNMRQVKISTEHTIFVDDLDELLLKITFHSGYTVLAEPILRRMQFLKNLAAVPLQDDVVPVSIIWNKNNSNPALKKLLGYIQKTGWIR